MRDVARRFTLLAVAILAAAAVIVVVLAIAPVRRVAGDARSCACPMLRTRGGVLIESLRTGLAALRDRQLAAVALLWTLASWLVLAFSGWCVLRAFDLHLPWHAALFLLVAVTFAQAVPASAGSVGVFELAARSALVAYGVPPAVALSAGLVAARRQRAAVHRARRGRHGPARRLRRRARPRRVRRLICEDCARR